MEQLKPPTNQEIVFGIGCIVIYVLNMRDFNFSYNLEIEHRALGGLWRGP